MRRLALFVIFTAACATPPKPRPAASAGGLTKQAVVAAMGTSAHKAARCYERYGQKGTVVLKIDVAPEGRITAVTVLGELADSDEGRCIADVVRGIMLPASPKAWSFRYPFMLR